MRKQKSTTERGVLSRAVDTVEDIGSKIKSSLRPSETSLDAIDLLNRQHDQVDELFAQAEKSAGATKKKFFLQIADALAIHATIEEKIFYPAAKAQGIEDIVLESLEEHLSIKRLIADLLDMPVSNEQFDAKLTVLKEQVQHHVREEKKNLFPKSKAVLNAEQREALGQEMQAMTSELEGRNPRNHVKEETAAAPHLQ